MSNITTTPRGKALGYMRQSPQKDTYLYTQEYLEGQIAVMVAGAAAEETVLGNRSTGAANDFQQAVQAAKQLIAAGMSSLGIVSLDDLPQELLHKEMQRIIAQQEAQVQAYLAAHKDLVAELAEILVQNEKVSGDLLRSRLASEKLAV